MILLPASILFLIASYPTPSPAVEIPWPWNARILERHATAEQHGVERSVASSREWAFKGPLAVRKMTSDEGEMFFPEYWRFPPEATADILVEGTPSSPNSKTLADVLSNENLRHVQGNVTMPPPAQAPFALHGVYQAGPQDLTIRLLRSPRALFSLSKRDFQCPSDTSACTSIDRPASCCPTGLTCQSITDSGSGDVGCCIAGQTCSQQVGSCQQGYTSCPGSQGGGCCVPGYTCVSEGCEVQSTATVTVNPTVTLSPSSSSTILLEAPSTSTQTDTTSTTSTVTASPSSTPRASSTSSTSSSEPPPTPTPTPIPVAPVRPTSGEAATSTTTTGPPTTVTPAYCPTGFYACSAYYHGGCCRTGRDCSDTSCPAVSSTVALNSNGVSIGVPAATTGPALGEGGCAAGWFTCGADGGGGCCPSGYACGESCTATSVNVGGGVTGTATVAKDNASARPSLGWSGLNVLSAACMMFMARLSV